MQRLGAMFSPEKLKQDRAAFNKVPWFVFMVKKKKVAASVIDPARQCIPASSTVNAKAKLSECFRTQRDASNTCHKNSSKRFISPLHTPLQALGLMLTHVLLYFHPLLQL